MKPFLTIALVTLGLLFAPKAEAAPAQPVIPPGAPHAQPTKLRQKIQRRIQLMRMNAIITALSLTPKQAPRFFAVVNVYEKKLKAVHQSNHKIMKQFRQMVQSGQYKAARINALALKLMKNQIQVKQLELKRFQAVRKIITAQQLAKLVIALPRIEQRIRRLIRRAQRRHRRGGWSPPLVGP